MFRAQVVSVLIIVLVAAATSDKFLAQKPDFLTPCKQTDPNFNKCFAKDFEVVFSQYKDGVPGLKTFGTIDPLHVKRVVIAEDGNSPVAINIELTDLEVIGFRNTKVLDASFDQPKLVTKLKFTIPEMTIKSNYAAQGRVLTLPINGNGKAEMKIQNLLINVICKLKRRDEDGMKFTDIQKVRLDIEVGGFHIDLENLFNGQKDLEQTANNLFNDSWKELFEALRPSITATIQTVLEDRYKKLFAYIPATYFIEDLE